MNAALRRLGFTKDEMTAHGFRSAASSMLNECGMWNADAIERQLLNGGEGVQACRTFSESLWSILASTR